jgi:hypothetical protein
VAPRRKQSAAPTLEDLQRQLDEERQARERIEKQLAQVLDRLAALEKRQ